MGFRGSRVQIPPSRLKRRADRLAVLRRRGPSRRMFAQILEAPREIPDQTQQHVHRGGLHVVPRLPSGYGVTTETKEAGQLGLRELVPLADRPDLVGRQQAL